MTTRYGYLGPRGTFCEMALQAWLGSASHPVDDVEHEPVPCSSVAVALAGVRAGELDAAMVPIENSVEGGVSATLDAMSVGDALVITAEVLVPVTFVLAAPAGVTLADVRAVGTHPHAWAQVRGWMDAHLPDAAYVPTPSTAASVAGLDASAGAPAPYQAGVSAPVAALQHGLSVLASDIGDGSGAVTRFVLVARPGRVLPPTGADKTSVVLYQRDDHPGGLLELLEQFATRGVNISRLESRPTGEVMGSYCFSIDFEGHVADERVGETLMGLQRVCAQVRFLGSYPRADGIPTPAPVGTAEADFVRARGWLEELRRGN